MVSTNQYPGKTVSVAAGVSLTPTTPGLPAVRVNLLGGVSPDPLFPGASIDLDFSNGRYSGVTGLPAAFLTTTRATPALAYANNSSGNWVGFAPNVPRITNLGLLVEESRTNQVTNSAVPTAGNAWTQENNTTILQGGQGPGSGLDAYLYDDGVAAAVTHRLIQPSNQTVVSATVYAASAFVKFVNSQWIQLAFPSAGFGATAYANFDIQNGAVGTVGAAATAQIIKYPNGWCQIAVIAPATASVGSQNNFLTYAGASNAIRSPNYTGANNQFLIWNSQMEAGASATSPIVTAGAAVTRAADIVTLTSPPAFGAAYSMFGQGTPQTPDTFGPQRILDINDGTVANAAILARTATAQPLTTLTGGTGGNITPAGPWSRNVSGKIALAVTAADQAAVFNAGTPAAAALAVLPATPTQVYIGNRPDAARAWNGFIQRVALWPTRISNTTLQSITA